MTPSRLSSVLRSISDRILASKAPSRSAVSRELRLVLAAMGSSSGPTKVVVCESWDEGEARSAAKKFNAVAIGQGPFDGSFGIEIPAESVDGCVSSTPGDGTAEERSVHVLDSWDEISGGDPEYAFDMLSL